MSDTPDFVKRELTRAVEGYRELAGIDPLAAVAEGPLLAEDLDVFAEDPWTDTSPPGGLLPAWGIQAVLGWDSWQSLRSRLAYARDVALIGSGRSRALEEEKDPTARDVFGEIDYRTIAPGVGRAVGAVSGAVGSVSADVGSGFAAGLAKGLGVPPAVVYAGALASLGLILKVAL